jgi:hypothetical protein
VSNQEGIARKQLAPGVPYTHLQTALIPQRKEVKNMPENNTFEFQMEELEQNAEPIQARMRIQLDVQGPTSSCGCAGGCASGIGEE